MAPLNAEAQSTALPDHRVYPEVRYDHTAWYIAMSQYTVKPAAAFHWKAQPEGSPPPGATVEHWPITESKHWHCLATGHSLQSHPTKGDYRAPLVDSHDHRMQPAAILECRAPPVANAPTPLQPTSVTLPN